MESVVISVELTPPRGKILKARLIVRGRKLKPVASILLVPTSKMMQRGKTLQPRLGLSEGGAS